MQGTVLIVDDQSDLAGFLARLIRSEGFDTRTAENAAEARKEAARLCPDVFFLDIRLPDADGVDLLKEFKAQYPGAQFIMMTAHGSIRTAIECTRLGAFEYLTKPFEPEEMMVALRNAMRGGALTEEVRLLRKKEVLKEGEQSQELNRFPSPAMRKLLEEAEAARKGEATVLITGESGAGKNHLAAWIHRGSPRADGPFFNVNLASLAPTLIESELFGHEPGAFTGAQGRKRGLFELADRGTLFLDEIGEMEPGLQAKLLSFLDTKTLRRLGGETDIKVDARVIAATNRDLAAMIEQGRFRQDLFYRLNVIPLRLPPLRERKEDIPELARELILRISVELKLKKAPSLSPAALQALVDNDFPGNIRELRNTLERAIFMAGEKPTLEAADFPARADQSARPECPAESTCFTVEFLPEGLPLHNTLSELTADLIREALKRAKTKKEAAELLGLTRNSLAHYIKSLKIEEN